MRIVHIQRMSNISGSEKYIHDLSIEQRNHGHQLHVIISGKASAQSALAGYMQSLNENGVTTEFLESDKVFSPAMFRQVARSIKKYKPDVVHTHLLHADVYAVIAKKLFGLKFKHVSTKHGYTESYLALNGFSVNKIPSKNPFYLLSKWIEPRIDQSFAVSKGLAQFYQDLKISKSLMPFVHHGLNDAQVIEAEVCRANAVLEERPVIMTIGRVVAYKGFDILLDAMAIVRNRFPDVLLRIVGTGPFRATLEQQCKNLGLDNQVAFMGYQSKPYPFYAAADLVVIPSRAEPFGLVFIEAFAHAKPVIGFNVAAGNEIIEDGKTGLLALRQDAESLAQTIMQLLSDKSQRHNLGINAMARIGEYYNYGRVYKEVIALYN